MNGKTDVCKYGTLFAFKGDDYVFEQVEVNSERWFDTKYLKNEIWKDIEGYEGLYQASNYGRIKSLNRKYIKKNNVYQTIKEKIMKQHIDNYGYYYTGLTINNITKRFKNHQIVAKIFLENENNFNEINHIDGNKQNNRVDNLEYCTHKHNVEHAWNNNLISRNKDNIRYGKNGYAKKISLQDYDGNIKTYDSIKRFIEENKISYSTYYRKYKNKIL